MEISSNSKNKIGPFITPESHAQNGRSDSTPRVLTLYFDLCP